MDFTNHNKNLHQIYAVPLLTDFDAVNPQNKEQWTMNLITWNPEISAKQEPLRGSQWSFLLYVGSTELLKALQVKVQCVGNTFSATPKRFKLHIYLG